MAVALLSIPAIYASGCPGYDELPGGPQGPEGPSHEEIQSLKVAYITSELGLTPEESQKFWPVYNQYWDERMKIGEKRRMLFKKIRKENPGDAQIDEMIRYMKDEVAVFEKYIPKFKEILPSSKVAKIFTSEEGFKRHLLQQANERGGGRDPR